MDDDMPMPPLPMLGQDDDLFLLPPLELVRHEHGPVSSGVRDPLEDQNQSKVVELDEVFCIPVMEDRGKMWMSEKWLDTRGSYSQIAKICKRDENDAKEIDCNYVMKVVSTGLSYTPAHSSQG